MKPSILAGAALLLALSVHAVAQAQDEAGQPPPRNGALREACAADVQKLCSGVEPGGHHVMECMRDHQDQISDGCKSALMSARASHHWRQGSSPADQPPPADAPPPGSDAQGPAPAAP